MNAAADMDDQDSTGRHIGGGSDDSEEHRAPWSV